MREKRDEIIILRTTKAEKNRIYEKMLGMGIRSLSAYIRKMALDGYCLNLDLPQLRRMAYLLQMCSNNLNQYAKAANEKTAARRAARQAEINADLERRRQTTRKGLVADILAQVRKSGRSSS